MSKSFTFFFRAENKNFDPETSKRFNTMEFAEDVSVQEAVRLAWEAGVIPKGSHRSGVFEIQTEDGIYSRVDEMRLDWSTPAKAAKVIFKTWEQLEAEDSADTSVE